MAKIGQHNDTETLWQYFGTGRVQYKEKGCEQLEKGNQAECRNNDCGSDWRSSGKSRTSMERTPSQCTWTLPYMYRIVPAGGKDKDTRYGRCMGCPSPKEREDLHVMIATRNRPGGSKVDAGLAGSYLMPPQAAELIP